MTHSLPARAARWGLPAILAVTLILGCLYAVYTPAWQSPDEPAHYNYIRTLAEEHRFPVLTLGDYPAAYLEEIKAARFPPEMSVEPIRYEFHQPPLYYLLALPVYRAFGGALLPLRLLSVAMGLVLLWLVYAIVQELAPHLALAATAFVAWLPMHVAMTASVNNDTLAELIVAAVLLMAVRLLKQSRAPDAGADTRLLVLLGITTGLGLVTKTSAYIAPVLVLAALLARHLWLDAEPPPARATLRAAACYVLPAAGLALFWWVRNAAVYGGLDLLGLGRHDQVVAGQLRTSEFVAAHGLAPLLRDGLVTTFHSFWGQFGWMGVVLDARLYQAMAVLSAGAALGFGAWVVRAWTERKQRTQAAGVWPWAAGGLLALSGLLTAASYVWYNLQFVQHQGRYLFPALVPIGLAFALGWREALRHDLALPLAGLAVVGALALGIDMRLTAWLGLMLAGVAAALMVHRFLPQRWDGAVSLVPSLALIPLALACLFLFVVPQLAR